MQYKSIILELFQQRPKLYDLLLKEKKPLPALDLYARELRERHLMWKERLEKARPGSDPIQIANEALEPALQEMETHLDCEFPSNREEMAWLDGAMAYVLRRMLLA